MHKINRTDVSVNNMHRRTLIFINMNDVTHSERDSRYLKRCQQGRPKLRNKDEVFNGRTFSRVWLIEKENVREAASHKYKF